MKFRYGYRTKDNEKREGVLSASSREDVYAQLRREGKKPYLVEPLPGFFNRVQGVGKRGFAIMFLSLVVIFLAVATWRGRSGGIGIIDTIEDSVRRQPIGDVAIIDKGVRDGWADVFTEEGDRFLASFAIPGVPAGVGSTSEDEVRASLDRKVLVVNGDSIEARQIKAMVEGMKQELRTFLADGGTIKQYGKRLVQRQEAEIAYYRRAKTELDRAIEAGRRKEEIESLLERHNAALRKMGIKLLVMPE